MKSSVDTGTFKTVQEADAVVNPTLAQVRSLLEQRNEPYVEGSLNRLRMWELRMERGNRVDERTPLYKNLPRDQIQKGLWKAAIPAASKFPRVSGYAGAWKLCEDSQAKDWGPKSEFLPFSVDGPSKVKAVFSDKPPKANFNWAAWTAACQDVASLLPRSSIHATTIAEALHGLGGNPKTALDGETNSCFPSWVGHWYRADPKARSAAQQSALDIIVARATDVWEHAKSAKSYKDIDLHPVATASQRTVSKGPDPFKKNDAGVIKSKRIVIAMPKDYDTVPGKTVMIRIQEALSKVRNPESNVRLIPAWSSQATLDKNVETFLQYAESKGRTVLSGDISNFDATLPPWAMWMVSEAMATWCDKHAANILLSILHASIYTTSCITPTGIIPEGPSSVKSGSIFTSLIGCMANYAIQRYGHHARYYRAAQHMVMGDDFVIDGDGVTPEALEATFADFGMECNASKQFVAPHMCHFLQRLYVAGCPGGQGSIMRCVNSSLSLEDDTPLAWDERNRYSYALQALARLENANFNPAFSEMVQFMAKGDQELHLGAGLDPDVILKGSGDYARRKMAEVKIKPWKTGLGEGVPFRDWAINRVLRGEVLPPPGYDRYKRIYGRSFASVAL